MIIMNTLGELEERETDLFIDSRTASFNSTNAQKTMNGNQVTITCATILLAAAASPIISGRGARCCFACDYSRICAGGT